MLTKWLGVLEVALLLGGLAGLLAGAYLLATSLLPGVTVILAIMVLLFCLVAKVAAAQERSARKRTARIRSERREFLSPQRRQSQ
jgi:uncharacterized membrane protein